jgi:hypothetical protein
MKKVYSKIVIDMTTDEVLEEEFEWVDENTDFAYLAEFKEGNLLVADDKGIFFGDSQSASITYNPTTDQLVFSSFETAGLTKTFYTMRDFGTATIPSGERYVDIYFGLNDKFPTATYTSIFQLHGSDDWYPAIITEKYDDHFRVEILGTAREDIGVDFLCIANQIDNPMTKSYLLAPATGSGIQQNYTVPQVGAGIKACSIEQVFKYSQYPIEFTDMTFRNYFPFVFDNSGMIDLRLAGNVAKQSGEHYYNWPALFNFISGDMSSLLGGNIPMTSGAFPVSAGALSYTLSQNMVSFTNPLIFLTMINNYPDYEDVMYLYTVKKVPTNEVWGFEYEIKFNGALNKDKVLHYMIIEGA